MGRISLIFIAVLLTLNVNLLLAVKVPGYIVTNSSDTIIGEVKVLRFDTFTGGITLFGINMEPFHSVLYFRENGSGRFESLTPNEISAFGFVYKSINYRFKSFTIETNSIVESESKRLRFLNLIYQGEIAVYKDIVRMDNFIWEGALRDKMIDHYDYYLFDDKQGLNKAIWTEQHKSVSDLLKFYEIDQAFIDRLPSDARFKNIIEILQKYEMSHEKSSYKGGGLSQRLVPIYREAI